ncbi:MULTISPECIES: hypothetical protein [unclassified Clostridium]|uniref:hypothetical protein n=1 Tax=unclassified Clostridium TaxID=2614128 RepID=UPI000297D24E|nr:MULTISPECIES: hypothetical protein [unclassified Clostridium]EKQ58261.1 MAG: hypothetical protein A370_00118 [Clostridium sp. Maddingley MBC34-26]
MNTKDIEKMKKLIEEKKKKGRKTINNKKAEKVIGKASKGVKVGNGGGLFDK